MRESWTWTGGQYSLYRALLGAFLVAHFAQLLPFGAEVFGAGGTLATAALSPLIGVLPNPLAHFDTPLAVGTLLITGILCGVLLAVGWFDRAAAVLGAVILAWLFQRNPLIANPSLPLLGWLLVLHAFVPPRPFGSLAARRAGGADPESRLPRHLFLAAWIMLAIAYSHSGYTKLFSPAWTDGETIRLVLENPLARDHVLRDFVLALPPVFLKWLTWAVLWIELLFAPLALVPRLRPFLWTAMLAAQLGFLCFLNFADLTFPMLLVHLLTFDPAWLGRRVPKERALLLFDGECAFCDATVRLAAMEDQRKPLGFAPLSSAIGQKALRAHCARLAARQYRAHRFTRARGEVARRRGSPRAPRRALVSARTTTTSGAAAHRRHGLRLRGAHSLPTRWSTHCVPDIAGAASAEPGRIARRGALTARIGRVSLRRLSRSRRAER